MAAFGLSVLGTLIAIVVILFVGYIAIGLVIVAWEKISSPLRPKSAVDLLYERRTRDAEAERIIRERYSTKPHADTDKFARVEEFYKDALSKK